MTYQITYTDITLMEMVEQHKIMRDDNWTTLLSWRNKNYAVDEIGVSQQTIDIFAGEKLVTRNRLSLLDIIFMGIGVELLSFGFPLSMLQPVKHCLFADFGINDIACFEYSLTALEFGFMRAISIQGDGNTYLLVAKDGAAIVMTGRDIEYNRKHGVTPESYICINLNTVLDKILINRDIQKWDDHVSWLNTGEMALINCLRNVRGNCEIVKAITNKKGLVERLETEFSCPRNGVESLHNEIQGIGFGEIGLKIKDGKVYQVHKSESQRV